MLCGLFFTTRILHELFQKNYIKYPYRAKEIEPAATKRRGLGVETDSASTGSKISIANFPDDVKSYYSDALSDSVISHLQISRKDSSLSSSIKFSLSEPVEEKDNLIAVHNIYTDNLAKSLKLGGFPMPSIAVTKADMGHENYGECSFVFDKSTIDPKADRENKVYGGDAWTPTYPSVDYKVNENVAYKARKNTMTYTNSTEKKSGLPKDILHTYSRLAPLTWNISCRYRRIIIIRVVRIFFAHLLNR